MCTPLRNRLSELFKKRYQTFMQEREEGRLFADFTIVSLLAQIAAIEDFLVEQFEDSSE